MTDALERVLERSQRLGFLGPGSVRAQWEHAVGFALAAGEAPARFLDLGSGGGIPGLVLAVGWPASEGVLLDAGERRCAFLAEAVADLDLDERVSVRRGRAEELARRADLRGSFDLVVARLFGPPAVTAECAAPFLRAGGRLVVSDPPGAGEERRGAADRWPPSGLALLGMERERVVEEPFHYQVLVQRRPCPDRYPRRVGVPAKRPLF
ncbi:MAG TPA: RsmG family class I SAM-dependent methyltransferase [Acidimicrobiales bacterium]